MAISISLMKHLMVWTNAPRPTPKDPTRSEPASHARAVLQLLARLSKKHSLAQKVLFPSQIIRAPIVGQARQWRVKRSN